MTKKLTRGLPKTAGKAATKKRGRPFIPEGERVEYTKMSMQLPTPLYDDLQAKSKELRRTKTSILIELIENFLRGDK